ECQILFNHSVTLKMASLPARMILKNLSTDLSDHRRIHIDDVRILPRTLNAGQAFSDFSGNGSRRQLPRTPEMKM
ncbi:hypothetical protein BaRGS_00001812, partial [Batillaria attramentaria]